VGKALIPQGDQYRLEPPEIPLEIAQANLESIAQMLAPAQFLAMAGDAQQAQVCRLQLTPVRLGPIGQIDTEPLAGHGALVLDPASRTIQAQAARIPPRGRAGDSRIDCPDAGPGAVSGDGGRRATGAGLPPPAHASPARADWPDRH